MEINETQYHIEWQRPADGRSGKGTKTFTREDGEALVQELNEDHPNIEHWLVNEKGERV